MMEETDCVFVVWGNITGRHSQLFGCPLWTKLLDELTCSLLERTEISAGGLSTWDIIYVRNNYS